MAQKTGRPTILVVLFVLLAALWASVEMRLHAQDAAELARKAREAAAERLRQATEADKAKQEKRATEIEEERKCQ